LSRPDRASSSEAALEAAQFDPAQPNVARVYDFYLGGKDNFAADRELAAKAMQVLPDLAANARRNREFLGRAVRFLVGESGIHQFLDIGTGLPTRNNVHQVAQEVAPASHVVYVDNDPEVLTHGRALLADGGNTRIIQADLRRSGRIVAHPDFCDLIDLKRPVAILLVAVLHFVEDKDDPYGAVTWLKEAMAPGSALVISHALLTEGTKSAAKLYESANQQGVPRTENELALFFDGLDMVEPGLVPVPLWRPDRTPELGADDVWWYGGVGLKL
jgi:hypothetical protein